MVPPAPRPSFLPFSMAMLPCHHPCLLFTLLTGRPKCITTTTTSFMLGSSIGSSMILIVRQPVKNALMHMSRGCMISPRRLQGSKRPWRGAERRMSKEQKKLQKMVDRAKQKELLRGWKEWWHNQKAWASCQEQVDFYDKLLHQAPTPGWKLPQGWKHPPPPSGKLF
ncbi:hypothetical protein BDR04DRAFT_840074 [Suillus decipiens]|nr:hypothetical protein BDR04DRAFT_840074 [Suillus decipiens]